MRNGENTAAQQLLETLLVDIIESNSENIDTAKTRVMELVFIISRAAVDGGAELSATLQLNVVFYQELLEIMTSDELCLWSINMLETFMNQLEGNRNQKNIQAIQKAAEYIRQNYRNKLTIDDIAQEVYLSPCYVSRIFKQSLGCTLMEYLTQVRVEEAKTYVKKPEI